MPQDPVLVFCINTEASRRCIVQELLRATEEYCGTSGVSICRIGQGAELLKPIIAARLLYVNQASPRLIELWLRVSADYNVLDGFETTLKREKGVSFQIVSKTRHGMVVRILVPREKRCMSCRWCPLTSAPLGSMVKSIIFTPDFMLLELVVAKPSALRELEDSGCRIVYKAPVEEVDYSLTEKQEYALIMAFLHGYYSYPRRISAKELASKLRISSSALAELLRKAEQRIITRYVIEELPHYLIQRVLPTPGPLAVPRRNRIPES